MNIKDVLSQLANSAHIIIVKHSPDTQWQVVYDGKQRLVPKELYSKPLVNVNGNYVHISPPDVDDFHFTLHYWDVLYEYSM